MIYKIFSNFLEEKSCQELIKQFDQSDHLKDDTEIGLDKYARYDFKDKVLAQKLYHLFPTNFIKSKNISFVSPLFYVSKYFPETNFIDYHYDGHKEIRGKLSKYTFVIYLNDNFLNGETVIDDREQRIIIKPKVGNCLILDQDVWHCGKRTKDGIKYILRGDLF